MKSINFSDQELEFLRAHYEMELEEAEEYVQNIKSMIGKLGGSKQTKAPVAADQKPKKRGRKPKVVKDKVVKEPAETKVIKKKRKPRSDKGGTRVKPVKATEAAPPMKEAVLPTSKPKVEKKSKAIKTAKKKAAPKPKKEAKPKPKKAVTKPSVVETPPVVEATPEKTE